MNKAASAHPLPTITPTGREGKARLLDLMGAEIDHVEAHSRGGSIDEPNLVTACHRCNLDKSNSPVEDFRKRVPLPSPRGKYGLANHCMLFFTKIWIAVHPIDRPRSSALDGPPEIDMCAPSKGDRLLVAGLGRVAVPVFRGISIWVFRIYRRAGEINCQIGSWIVPNPRTCKSPSSTFPAKSTSSPGNNREPVSRTA